MFDALKHESFADFLANHWLFILFWGWLGYESLKSIANMFKSDKD